MATCTVPMVITINPAFESVSMQSASDCHSR